MRVDRLWIVLAACCGLAATAWGLLVPVVAGCASASYSQVSQYVSELGASGAAHARLVAAAGFAPTGALVLAFLALVSGVLPRSRPTSAGLVSFGAVGAAYLASAAFPCDPGCPTAGSPSQSVHNAFGLLEYLGAIAGLVLLHRGLRRAPSLGVLASACLVAAGFVALGFLAMLTPALAPFRGVSQRIAEAAIFLWIGHASVVVLRLDAGPARADRASAVLASPDRPAAVSPPASGEAASELDGRWRVWRRDEHGNRFEVSRGHSEGEARRRVAELERAGHKQTYFAEREPGRAVQTSAAEEPR